MSRALLVQYRPAIRVYKLAWVLRKLGHGVCIVYDPRARPIEEHAWMARTFPHVPAASPEEIDLLAEGMDVVFHFNTDIAFTDGAAGHPGYALYVGDIGSVRERSRAEKTERETRNLRRARGVIFCSEEQARVADEEHGHFSLPGSFCTTARSRRCFCTAGNGSASLLPTERSTLSTPGP